MFGRDGTTMLKASLLYIEEFATNKNIVTSFAKASLIKEEDTSKYEKWRKTIKTCKFQCWNCQACDKLEPLI